MPHTSNVSGASLVPDIRGLTAPLSQAFQARSLQQQEVQKQEALQKQIDIIGQTGLTPEQEQAALLRIGKLAGPQMLSAFNQVLARGDEAELAATQLITEQAGKDAIFLQGIKDPLARQQAITTIAERQAASPDEDPTNTLALANLTPAEQDNRIQSQITQATDFNTLLSNARQEGFTLSEGQIRFGPGGREIARGVRPTTPQEQFTPVFDKQGNILGQRSSLTGKVVEDPRTPTTLKTTAPITETGKINRAIETGEITQEQGNRLLVEELKDPDSFENFKEELRRDKLRIQQEQALRLDDPTERLALQQLALNVESKRAAIRSSKETLRRSGVLKTDAKRLIDELLANADGVTSFVGPVERLFFGDFALGAKTLQARTKISQLKSILTAENLGLMTGVLSESDLKILADIAGGGLDVGGDENLFINELKRMQQLFSAPASPAAPVTPGTIGRFGVRIK